MASVPNPADIRYGGFYLPVFSLLYIYQEVGLPVELPLPVLRFVLHDSNFSLLIGLTFLGAIVSHGASRSIYGLEGAKNNPKSRWAVLWYSFLFSVKKKPKKPPETIDHLERKLEHSISWFEELSTGWKVLIVFYRIARFGIIWPARLVFLGAVLLTTWVLTVSAVGGTLQLLGGLLLVSQLIFFFGSWIFNRFPTAVPVESAPWIYLAEYEKASYLFGQDDFDFEYDPRSFKQSVLDEFEEAKREIYNSPSYYNDNDTDWLVPIEESAPDYLVRLDDTSADGQEK